MRNVPLRLNFFMISLFFCNYSNLYSPLHFFFLFLISWSDFVSNWAVWFTVAECWSTCAVRCVQSGELFCLCLLIKSPFVLFLKEMFVVLVSGWQNSPVDSLEDLPAKNWSVSEDENLKPDGCFPFFNRLVSEHVVWLSHFSTAETKQTGNRLALLRLFRAPLFSDPLC